MVILRSQNNSSDFFYDSSLIVSLYPFQGARLYTSYKYIRIFMYMRLSYKLTILVSVNLGEYNYVVVVYITFNQFS